MESQVLLQTKKWLEEIVIGLNLCPFAAKPFRAETIAFVEEPSDSEEQLTNTILEAVEQLLLSPRKEIETTLIILTQQLSDFEEYWDYVSWLDEVLEEAGVKGIIQIATFHPNYQFEGEEKDALSNFTNRSPYPLIHLIREKSVEEARNTYPEIDEIPAINKAHLEEIGRAAIVEKLAKIKLFKD